MTYRELSALIRSTLKKEEWDKEIEVRIGKTTHSNLTLVSRGEDTFLKPEHVYKTPKYRQVPPNMYKPSTY